MNIGTASANSAHQFFVTHCARNDSVLNTVGFSVRASSSDDPAMLKLAMEYPAFELPMDQWAKKPSRADAPRRLARIRVAEGVMVVHTGYLEKDTMNRDRNYFTHVMLLPSASPKEVLKSWNAPEWRTDYPPGGDKALGIPKRVPSGDMLDDDALREFLSSADLGPAGVLATSLWSDRLRADRAARQTLVGQFLNGVLLAAADANRNRLFVHAEPGLVALLCFAAARMLPPAFSADLTFTTFEPAHRGLREFKRALIVGTYLANPARGLDAELTNVRGYALDAISPARSSRELQTEIPPGIARLVELAAAGKSKSIKAIHELCNRDRVTAIELSRAGALASALERLDSKKHTPEDLLVLQKDPQGQAALAAREADFWPQVCSLVVEKDRKDVLDAFRPWFASTTRTDQLTAAGFEALSHGNIAGWQSRWRVLQNVFPQPAELGAVMDRLLAARSGAIAALSPPARNAIRASLQGVRGVRPEGLGPILTPGTAQELDQILTDQTIPPFGTAFAVLMARLSGDPAMRQRVASYLAEADAGVLGEYARQAVPYFDEHIELADELFDLDSNGSAPLFDRLLNTGSESLTPAEWMWAARRLELFKDDRRVDDLVKGLRLAKFLRAVGADPAGRPAWDWVYDRIKTADILRKTSPARTLWTEVDRAEALIKNDGSDPMQVFPPRLAKLRLAGRRLLACTEGSDGAAPPGDIKETFREFGLDESTGFARLFQLTCGNATPETDPRGFDAFAELFGSALPPSEDSYQKNNRSLTAWIQLASTQPEENQAELHAFYFWHPKLSPQSTKRRLELLDEPRQFPIHSRVAADVRMEIKRARREEKQVSREVKKGAALKKKWLKRVPIGVGILLLIVGAGYGAKKLGGKKDEKAGAEVAENFEPKQSPGKEVAVHTKVAAPAPTGVETIVTPPVEDSKPPKSAPSAPSKTGPETALSAEAQAALKNALHKKPVVAPPSNKPKRIAEARKAIDREIVALTKSFNSENFPIDDSTANVLKRKTDALLSKLSDLLELVGDTADPQLMNEVADWRVIKESINHLKGVSSFAFRPNEGNRLLEALSKEFDKIKTSDAAKEVLRVKVQQFCDQYVPIKLALDDQVLFKDRNPRRTEFKYTESFGTETEKKSLTADPASPSEANKKDITAFYLGGERFAPEAVKPNAKSNAAWIYYTARQRLVQNKMNSMSWTFEKVDALMKEMDKLKLEQPKGARWSWDTLPFFVTKGKPQQAQVHTRVKNVHNAAQKYSIFNPNK